MNPSHACEPASAQEFYRMAGRHPALSAELVSLLSSVETATIGHVEYLGFLDPSIRPLQACRIVGSAFTVAAPGRDGSIIYQAIDLLQPGDVLCISRLDRDDVACVGGGVATAAKAKGAVGIILDGPCTDPVEIIEIGLPVWSRGVSAKTTNRKIHIGGAINVPIACGGVPILAGDAVLADASGVFVCDRHLMQRLGKIAVERQSRSAQLRPHLAAGRSIFDYKPET
ncbi:RraA family protein [Rhizobium halophytocola]